MSLLTMLTIHYLRIASMYLCDVKQIELVVLRNSQSFPSQVKSEKNKFSLTLSFSPNLIPYLT